MNTTDTKNAAAEILTSFANNITDLKAAIEIAKIQRAPGYVFVWPEYWLGVAASGTKSQAVGIHRATITHKADKRVFTNGKGEQAVLMDVREALEGALAHALQVLADMNERLGMLA
jgi:hypothetical protein